MTVEVARPTRRRAPAAKAVPEPTISSSSFASSSSIAIGEIDQTVFDCPTCARPLALGARRCPGCRTRLLNGVTLGKAAAFVAAGVAIGLLFGAGGGLVFGLTHPVTAAGGSVATDGTGGLNGGSGDVTNASHAPATPAPTAAPKITPTPDTGISPVTRSALVQVASANDRFAAADTALRAALAARVFDASAVAQVLRAISADSVFAQQLADRVVGWPGSSEVGTQLGTFYRTIHDIAAEGLVASVRNDAAYRAAATAMVRLLGGLPAIDAAVRAMATATGVDLPSPGAPPAP